MARSKSNTADLLVDAAEKHFAERGYDASSLNDIAAEVGIRTPSLYSHFKNKQALYEAVFQRRLKPLFTLFEDHGVFPEDADQARELFREVMGQLLRHPNLARLMQYAVLAGGDSVEVLMAQVYRPLVKMLEASIADLPEQQRRERRLLFAEFHSMIFGFFTFGPVYTELLGQSTEDEDVARDHLEFLESLIGSVGN
ncbi:MAG: TetR/AcrR family transcriptional regulator [Halieaceae bacterium]|jgi:TetR/AcrR family transcriptional regulator